MEQIVPIIKEENYIESEHHSLFWRKIPAQIVENENGTQTVLYPEHTQYELYVGEFDDSGKPVNKIFNKLWEAEDDDTLVLKIDSYGGSISEGIRFYNIIKNKFTGVTMSALDTDALSMGALMFCMADERVVYDYSTIMFHNYSGFYYGKGGEIDAQYKHSKQKVERFFNDVVVKPGFFTEEEFDDMKKGVDFWFDSEEMLKRGIATHIVTGGEMKTREEYLGIETKEVGEHANNTSELGISTPDNEYPPTPGLIPND